ncbi:hypothetical protein ZWY2020_010809 [Hordeum vulgare]|nr:hypothetical protein ZWY2020_010809 [Hordeum vulgare]
MDVATGAMDSLLPKLGELLVEEYMLQARVKKDVQRLRTELTVMYAALREVRDAPRDQLDGQAKLCADRVRDLSGSLSKVVACGKGNCTVTKVCRKDSRQQKLLAPALAQWQGPALLAHNDADFASISRIGGRKKASQAWKTVRFGYVALNKLMRAITVDTQAVQRHMVSILECVKAFAGIVRL